MAVVSDMRGMTMDAAVEMFHEYAARKKQIEKRNAASAVRIQAEKDRTQEANAEDAGRMDEIAAALTVFVQANRQTLFRRPRKRKTDVGTFGLDSASKVEVTDEGAVIEFAEAHSEYLGQVVRETKSVLRTELAKALRGGWEIPGAHLVTGEVVVMTVSKDYIEQP